MKIKPIHRQKLSFYLKEFYKKYRAERYTIFHFVKYFKERLKSKKDAWIGVSGETGVGKSFFVIMSMILFGRPMSLDKNIAYIPKGNEIIEMFEKLNFQAFLIDEAAREMRAVNWQSKQQQGVNVRAMTDRFRCNFVFLNMPNFNEFTKSMRLGNLQFRAIIVYRTGLYARVFIQRKSRNWRSDDPWGDIEADNKYKLFEKRYKEINNETILKIERSLPSTIMDFIIPNLEIILPDVTNEYERLKIESRKKDNILVDNTQRVDLWRKKYSLLMERITKVLFYNELGLGKLKVNKREMATALDVSYDAFNRFLNQRSVTNVHKKILKEDKGSS